MALVRFTQTPQQTDNQQLSGVRTQQSTNMYSRMYQQLKGIQESNFGLDQELGSVQKSRIA